MKLVTAVSHRLSYRSEDQVQTLLERSQGGSVLNTALIERFNGTMRQRLATLTRKCRHLARRLHALQAGMYLIGCT